MADPEAKGNLARASRARAGGPVGLVECQAREPPPAGLMGMGRNLAADEEEGLDRAAAADDAASGTGSWPENAGVGGPDRPDHLERVRGLRLISGPSAR